MLGLSEHCELSLILPDLYKCDIFRRINQTLASHVQVMTKVIFKTSHFLSRYLVIKIYFFIVLLLLGPTNPKIADLYPKATKMWIRILASVQKYTHQRIWFCIKDFRLQKGVRWYSLHFLVTSCLALEA